MTKEEALALLAPSGISKPEPATWADLGCGRGIFTLALADLLSNGSTIFAMDMDKAALEQIPREAHHVEIRKIAGNFVNDVLPFDQLDGILMANALHFVQHKEMFIEQCMSHLRPGHAFLIVEYEIRNPNRWVPFPLDYNSLGTLFGKLGYTQIRKISERDSIFNQQTMYSAQVSR